MLLTINSKMKKSAGNGIKIVNFTLPAFRTASGEVTCPNATHCVAGCYARQGTYLFSNVRVKHHANFEATKHPLFGQLISDEIKKLKPTHVRIHDSGDFYGKEYLEKWVSIAKANPNVTFYAYTKMIALIKATELPKNMLIIFSFGGKEDSLIDKDKDRHSMVAETWETLEAQGYVNASENDMLAIGENKRIGLVYHGNKSYNNTTWGKVA
jgi:hypothetical protein